MAPPVSSVRQLLGREPQLAVARSMLEDLARSRGGLLVLAGEPGIGKTRLAEEILTEATAAGAGSAWASGWPGDGAPPLWPWSQILRQITGSDGVLDRQTEATPIDSTAVRFAQLEEVASVVRDACARRPLVVVLDDAQWADPASIRVLLFVAAATRDLPCLLLATCRSGELPRDTAAELARAGTTLAVPPLSREAAAALLRAATGEDVPAPACDAIVTRSGGNPLFVWEFGQLMAQSGRFDVAPAAVPDAVAVVIERRLARLPEATVALLRAGAVAGDPFSVEVAATVAGAAVEDTVAGLAAAIGDGLLVDSGPGTMTFGHALMRDVVLDSIDAASRADLHRRAAAVFQERAAREPAMHAIVADHLLRAGPGDVAVASEHWELAARQALRVVAYDEAAVLFGRAAHAAGEDRVRWVEMTVAQGEALLLAGDLVAARECFVAAATTARAAGAAELFARAVLGTGTGPVAWEVPIADDAQVELVTEALAMLPPTATAMRSALLARLSVAAATPETQDLARTRASEALTLAEADGDPALIGQALAAMNDARAGPSHTIARRENADTIVELAMAAGDRALELLGHRFLVVADLEAGDLAAVDRDIDAFARVAATLHQPLLGWYVPLFRGMRALLRGDLARAEQHQSEVQAAADATGSVNAMMLAATLGLGISVARRVPPDPWALDGILDVDPAVWSTYAAGLSFTSLHGGELDRARTMLRLHADNGFARLGEDSEQLTTLVMFGRVAIELGEVDAMGRVHDLLLPHRGLWAVDGIAACCWGPVDLELGRLALALGHDGEARAHLERAGAALARADAPLLQEDLDDLVRRCGAGVPGPEHGDENVFRSEGQFWTLGFAGTTVHLKDAKGLHDLARLLAEPGREVHVLDLAGGRELAGAQGHLGELVDARARAEYRRRLAELDDELAHADATGDADRAEKAAVERDFLLAELAAAFGLGGRPRRAGDPVERARKAVAGRIRMTIGRIDREHPALARHLLASVRTGTYCVYRPERGTDWSL